VDERLIRINLANLQRILPHADALGHPETVSLIYGCLGTLRRAGRIVEPEEVRTWALEAGWTPDSASEFAGIARVVRDGLPDIGALSTPAAADGSLIVSLTADEALVARAALHEVLFGTPEIRREGMSGGDVLALIGYDAVEARAVLEALNKATGRSGWG
jgi:hypothetical protein